MQIIITGPRASAKTYMASAIEKLNTARGRTTFIFDDLTDPILTTDNAIRKAASLYDDLIFVVESNYTQRWHTHLELRGYTVHQTITTKGNFYPEETNSGPTEAKPYSSTHRRPPIQAGDKFKAPTKEPSRLQKARCFLGFHHFECRQFCFKDCMQGEIFVFAWHTCSHCYTSRLIHILH